MSRLLSRLLCTSISPLCTITVLSFFFQAEDGIRDFHVTGVQTCALPIFDPAKSEEFQFRRKRAGALVSKHRFLTAQVLAWLEGRSEERRVGKECRSRGEQHRGGERGRLS